MALLRQVLGRTLRARRERQHRTLREVSGAARVSLGYLSEVERGQKEASSELLASICEALGTPLSEVLVEAGAGLRAGEAADRLVRREFLPMPTSHGDESVPAGVTSGDRVSARPDADAGADDTAVEPAPAINSPTAQGVRVAQVSMAQVPMAQVAVSGVTGMDVPERTAREIEETLRAMAADMERQAVGV